MRGKVMVWALCASSGVQAGQFSDLWWVPQESGWGVSTQQQGRHLALTLYVHDAQGRPHWYSASLLRYGHTQAGLPEFSGTLYATAGSPAGLPWDPQSVSSQALGEVLFRVRADGRAELDYVLDGVPVHKEVERFTHTADTLVGLHYATLLPGYDSCPAGFEGLRVFERGTLEIERCGDAPCELTAAATPIRLSMNDGQRFVCSIEGEFTRHGNSGDIKGTYRCGDGGEGDIELNNIEFNSVGFVARFRTGHPQCAEFSGILSAVSAAAR